MPINGRFTPYDKERGENAIHYIHAHFTENISADSLAMEVDIDIKLLQIFMHATTGLTVHHYLLKVRIDHSYSDLANFRKSIASIALKLGFSDHGHFDRVFKKYTGLTPTQYRTELINKGNSVDNTQKNDDKNFP